MLKLHTSDLKQTGDTIVEVIIALAIVSLILASSYATTRRNVAINQDTQERTQAGKMVQGQIEYLRSQGSIASGYCFSNVGVAELSTDALCAINIPGTGAVYNLNITKDAAANPTYTVSAKWSNLLGSTSNVTMYYRPN